MNVPSPMKVPLDTIFDLFKDAILYVNFDKDTNKLCLASDQLKNEA